MSTRDPEHPHYADTLPQGSDAHVEVLRSRVGCVVAERYTLRALLGHGGMSAVYEAVQAPLDRVVALKVLKRTGARRRALFEREAAIVSRLRHPNNVTLYDYGFDRDGEAFLVMERLSGHSLAIELSMHGALSAERAIGYAMEVCAALAEAHASGVVHRDLKPGNLMLDTVGGVERVKVIDYGVALESRALVDHEETEQELMFGTPLYSSPEQVMGHALDGRSDLYALGVVLFEMLTGQVPFEGDMVMVLIDHVRTPAPRLDAIVDGLPPTLVDLVARLLAKDPDARPSDAESTRLELMAIARMLKGTGQSTPSDGDAVVRAARQRLDALRAAGAAPQTVEGALDALIRARRAERIGRHLEPGVAIGGRYVLEQQLGRGGFATVWAAQDELEGRRVALKLLHGQWSRDRTRRERFFRGARLMQQLEHPAVVDVLEPEGHDEGWHYYVLEYVDGSDLARAVLDKRLAGTDGVMALGPVAEALAEAHGRAIVHRDVKPHNILVDREGRCRITDFDLVMAADTTGGTRTGALGTFLYAAPELLASAKDAGPAADQYGLAMTVMFVLSGGELPPWVVRRPEAVVRELPCGNGLKRVLLRAIAFNASERFDDIRRFHQAMAEAIASDARHVEARRARASVRVAQPGAAVAAVETRPGLVRVPAGDFMMGAGDDLAGATPFEKPRHAVQISTPYLMAATPVTRAQFAAVMGEGAPGDPQQAPLPVRAVSWFDAVAYCNALSTREGLAPAYRIDGSSVDWRVEAGGYRLPTEAEWEWACRGGTESRYWSGDDEADLDRVAWYAGNSFGEPRAVGLKPANAYGLHDMHGNVFEWCFDRLGRYPAGMVVDPQGPAEGKDRVIRGGSAWNDAGFARTTYRIWRTPTARFPSLGFRVVRSG